MGTAGAACRFSVSFCNFLSGYNRFGERNADCQCADTVCLSLLILPLLSLSFAGVNMSLKVTRPVSYSQIALEQSSTDL